MSAVIVLGLQWGDEGKGKIVDLLSKHARHVVRAQGGNNAGHTIKVENRELALHLVPSGILYPHTHCYIGGGTVIDPEFLLKEIHQLQAHGIAVEGKIHLSQYAHVIFPYHRLLDELNEKRRGKDALGTTGRGIGPCYVDRDARIGIRICDLLDPHQLSHRLQHTLKIKNEELKLFNHAGLGFDDLFNSYRKYGEQLKKYVSDVEVKLAVALRQGENVLFEGAHGTYLDVTFGTFPYVTSSSTLASGIACGAGVGPNRITSTLGVAKAYTTRVGNGPFPTELDLDEQKMFLDPVIAREVGTTTGRMRRIGWFDVPLVKFAIYLNGVDALALTKLDILDGLSEIKICIGYRLGGEMLSTPPASLHHWEQLEPVYEILPGWNCSTKEIKRIEDLPLQARKYLSRIEELCETSISILSVGPERERTIILEEVMS